MASEHSPTTSPDPPSLLTDSDDISASIDAGRQDNTVLPAMRTVAQLDPATYTVAQFATVLQCSERHVWRQIDLGAIPGVLRIGRLVRISRTIADAWLAAGSPSHRRASR